MKGISLTSAVTAALGRKHPGVGEAGRALGLVSTGGGVLLSDLSVGFTTETTSLSLHPVHNINLKDTGLLRFSPFVFLQMLLHM